MIKELERVSPSEAGLSPDRLMEYINALQNCGAEMHGIMVLRHGRVCAEGWWRPYSPMLRHGQQSLTKSYTATAIGLLFTEGSISLDERLIDILPEYMPDKPCENLSVLTVHDLLCMASGLSSMQDRTKASWVSDLFSSPFADRPGSKFFYSGVVTSILGVVVRKKTGLGLMEFLKPRLFDKIGIKSENLKWIEHPDGLEYGGGGILSTTEDNLRLGLLYLNNGVFDNERILSEEWVRLASSKHMDTPDEPSVDTKAGYGYQMWMCQPEGVYRFDGAHGQFSIVIPSLDMVIAMNQYSSAEVVQRTLDLTWEYLKTAEGSGSKDKELALMLSRLSLPRVKVLPQAEVVKQLANKAFSFEANAITVFPAPYHMLSHKVPKGVDSVRFGRGDGEILAAVRCGDSEYELHISLDGVDRISTVHVAHDLPELVYASGVCSGGGALDVRLRYIETCYSAELSFRLSDGVLELAGPLGSMVSPEENSMASLKSVKCEVL